MKQVLIVGASRGLGLEFVRQYLADGARVTATARDAAGLARLQSLGATALQLDVANAESASGLATALAGAAFHTVVINAGVYGPRSTGLELPTEAEFDEVMHTNVLGAMRVLTQLAGALEPGARLAVISSRMGSMGLRASPVGWLYRASKAALNSVLKDASLVLARQAVCVALHPGWVRTDMGRAGARPGAAADIDVAASVADMRRTLAVLTDAENGGFFNHDGQPLAW